MVKTAFCILLALHGLIHILGFVKAFKPAWVPALKTPIPRFAGVLWLLTAAFFCAAAAMWYRGDLGGWLPAVTALVASQVLIILSWQDAMFGTAGNVIAVFALATSLSGGWPVEARSLFEDAARPGLKRLAPAPPATVTEADLKALPPVVRRYLEVTGTVGRPRVRNIRAGFKGVIKIKKDGGWLDFASDQLNFFDDSSRFYYIYARGSFLPYEGLHRFSGANASMKVTLGSLFTVLEQGGPDIRQGETVTIFNDMCLLAPSSLLDPLIAWEAGEGNRVKAQFPRLGLTATAELYFNDAGELVNFVSRDRFAGTEGGEEGDYTWSTPVREYKDFNGRRVASYGEALWETPEGAYTYGKFSLVSLETDCTEIR